MTHSLDTKRGGAEIERLRLEMLVRRLSPADLAEKAGVNLRVIRNVLAANNHCWPPRRAINVALHRKIFLKPAARRRANQPQRS